MKQETNLKKPTNESRLFHYFLTEGAIFVTPTKRNISLFVFKEVLMVITCYTLI
ncbi:hypothetical protein ACIQWQ_26160 [Peribacillus frigoritolerans]